MKSSRIYYLSIIGTVLFFGSILILSNCKNKKNEKSLVQVTSGDQNNLTAGYVGRENCRECHQKEYDLYTGSDHDLAMDEANDSTVLGDFDNSAFTQGGITSRFYKKDGKYYVNTEGPDGAMTDFQVSYTFGVRPLQQYLVGFPGGAFQMLPFCWDTRPAENGGQKWFHIYDQERIPPDDFLFWTHIMQNWNYMCSECHSTNVKKQFNHQTETYNTVWNEIDVSCESCHGPGSRHLEWADNVEKGGKQDAYANMGLVYKLKDTDQGTWVFDMEKGTAQRSVPRTDNTLVEMCARCHSRRSIISEDYVYGKSFLDTHRPSLLTDDLYFDDGQIQEEVYVYASFLQSKMFQSGVVCKDCHESHSGKVFVLNNALCYRCHLAEKYGSRDHHFHDPEDIGGSCYECHMPERTYMVVDPRRDHSIRIPRPDLSIKLGSPNACNKCHPDKSNEWSAAYMKEWYNIPEKMGKHYGEVFWAARRAYPEAQTELIRLIRDRSSSPMTKATAINYLQNYPDPTSLEILGEMLSDPDPLIRFTAAEVLEMAESETKARLLIPLLDDPVRLVRTTAARALASVPPEMFSNSSLRLRDRRLDEYMQTQLINADHPSAHMNLGILYLNLGDYANTEASYQKAIELEPGLMTPYINLADLYRMLERDDEGEVLLRTAVEKHPELSAVHYALGLLLVRKSAVDEALIHLKKAAELEPRNARYSYVYAVALNSSGKPAQAIGFLEKALKENPYDRDLLVSLASFNQDQGNIDEAVVYARRLTNNFPADQSYRQLLNYLLSLQSREQ